MLLYDDQMRLAGFIRHILMHLASCKLHFQVARGKLWKCLPCKCRRRPFQCKCSQMATLFCQLTPFSSQAFFLFYLRQHCAVGNVNASHLLSRGFCFGRMLKLPMPLLGRGAINLCPIEAFKFISIPHTGRDFKRFLHSAGGSANLLPANKFHVIHSHFLNWNPSEKVS